MCSDSQLPQPGVVVSALVCDPLVTHGSYLSALDIGHSMKLTYIGPD